MLGVKMELKKDKLDLKVVGDKVEVTRVIVEEFTLDEYLNNVLKMEMQVENLDKQSCEVQDVLNNYGKIKEKVKGLIYKKKDDKGMAKLA